MRYIALKRLAYTGEDGVKHVVLPGEGVAEFERWPSGVKHANIHAHLVRDTQALAPTIVGQELRMACYGPEKPCFELDERSKTLAVDAGTDATLTEGASGLLLCPHCDHRGFAVKNSLMQHIKRKH